MPIEVTMPRLSDTMEAGTVVKWHVAEGDTVSTGDIIADIETDKATMELESFDDGTVASLAVAEGDEVAVGSLILVIAEEGEDVASVASGMSASDAGSERREGSGSPAGAPGAPTAVVEPPDAGERVFASPLARKLAAEAHLDLRMIKGTGPGGRIIQNDVEAALARGEGARTPEPSRARPTASPVSGQIVTADERVAGQNLASAIRSPGRTTLEPRSIQLSNMRGTIARRLVESKTTIPHYQVTIDVDMDAMVDLRAKLNSQLAPQAIRLTVNDFIVRACALAMHEHPYVNASWADNDGSPSIEIHGEVNIGVAIALPEQRGGGLVVATLRNADLLGLRQISGETRRLAVKAREKGLTLDEMGDATFTISNLGMFGVEEFSAIINPPNAAILAVGSALQQPVVKNGELTVGWRMKMTMSSDHRIIDGAMAAEYLATVRDMLESPATLLV